MQAQQGSSIRFFADLIAVFAVLSVADLYLTWKLIEIQQSEVIESNPLAAKILKEFGWAGLSVFKSCMVAAIAGAAVTVVRRCRRSGELLMVFGCGAQGAIVATSVFLCTHTQPTALADEAPPLASSHVEPVKPLPVEAMRLLGLPTVRRELTLSGLQIELADEIEQHRRDLKRAARLSSLDDLSVRVGLISNLELTFMHELSPTQRKRLYQLTWQVRGALALVDDDLVRTLGLSEDQAQMTSELQGRINEIEARRHLLSPREIEEALARCKDDLWANLTPVQKTQWTNLQGEPFPLEPMPIEAE